MEQWLGRGENGRDVKNRTHDLIHAKGHRPRGGTSVCRLLQVSAPEYLMAYDQHVAGLLSGVGGWPLHVHIVNPSSLPPRCPRPARLQRMARRCTLPLLRLLSDGRVARCPAGGGWTRESRKHPHAPLPGVGPARVGGDTLEADPTKPVNRSVAASPSVLSVGGSQRLPPRREVVIPIPPVVLLHHRGIRQAGFRRAGIEGAVAGDGNGT